MSFVRLSVPVHGMQEVCISFFNTTNVQGEVDRYHVLDKNADENPTIRQMPQSGAFIISTETARIRTSRLYSSTSTRDRARFP